MTASTAFPGRRVLVLQTAGGVTLDRGRDPGQVSAAVTESPVMVLENTVMQVLRTGEGSED